MSDYVDADAPGRLPAFVQEFSIEGLYGYRKVSLTSSFAATILIAGNGSGKTTLLGALDAFLRGQFIRLVEINFKKITCRLSDVPFELVLEKEQIVRLSRTVGTTAFIEVSARYGIDPKQLFEYMEVDRRGRRRRDSRSDNDNPVFEKITAKADYSYRNAVKEVDKIASIIENNHIAIAQLRKIIDEVVGRYEIVYLPTYRRIELPLPPGPEGARAHARRAASIGARLGVHKTSLYGGDIQFGMADITERLRELNQSIVINSNEGYARISANIINELADGTYENEPIGVDDLPDEDSLNLFFSRLKSFERRNVFGPFNAIANIPDIKQIMSQHGRSADVQKFLTYFLSKLNQVMLATKGIERRVEDFIISCNSYLSSGDFGLKDAGAYGPSVVQDGKALVLSRKDLKVIVTSTVTGGVIPFDSLSSGEKQMISLFAELYLYEKDKIILIDEPELSLSLDWQRRILMDVIKAPTCKQIVAITHSPFIFENALEPFAKPLSVTANVALLAPQGDRDLGELFEDLHDQESDI